MVTNGSKKVPNFDYFSVPCHILVHRLDSNLKPCAAITQHVRQMSLETVIWPGLDGDTNAFTETLFTVFNCLRHIVAAVT